MSEIAAIAGRLEAAARAGDAARAQLANARARGSATRNNLGRSKVTAPTEGVIETQIVSAGDYVKVGDPLYRLVSNRILKAHLPYPESAAPRTRAASTCKVSASRRVKPASSASRHACGRPSSR